MNARLPTLCAAALLLALPSARATSFAVLLIPGIEGESRDPAYPGGIELLSLGVSAPLNTGRPGSFSILKRIDKASPLLARRCATGEHIRQAKLILRTSEPRPGEPAVVCIITMSDLLVSSYRSEVAPPDPRPTETVSLRFGRALFRYFESDGNLTEANLSLAQAGGDGDGDGMPDAWETYFGLDPNQGNAADDADGDGLTNLQELRLGTNPVSAASRFSAGARPVRDDPDHIDVSWDAVPGSRYVIEWSPNLDQPFVPLGGEVEADAAAMTVRINKSGPTGFFRVRPATP